jgi:hypothetical protein
VTHLRNLMLEELERPNIPRVPRWYLMTIKDLARYFHQQPDSKAQSTSVSIRLTCSGNESWPRTALTSESGRCVFS